MGPGLLPMWQMRKLKLKSSFLEVQEWERTHSWQHWNMFTRMKKGRKFEIVPILETLNCTACFLPCASKKRSDTTYHFHDEGTQHVGLPGQSHVRASNFTLRVSWQTRNAFLWQRRKLKLKDEGGVGQVNSPGLLEIKCNYGRKAGAHPFWVIWPPLEES